MTAAVHGHERKIDPQREMPASPDYSPTTQRLLARPENRSADLRVAERNAINSGDLGWARIIGAMKAVMDCKMTLKGGGGVMEWNTLEIRKGGPVTVYRSLNFYRTREEDDELVREEEQREERRAGLERMERQAAENRAAELERLRRDEHGEAENR
jgi:hypothetical protein